MPSDAFEEPAPALAVAIPHFFDPNGSGCYGSTRPAAEPRLAALRAAILGLWRCFGGRWGVLEIAGRRVLPGPRRYRLSVHLVTSGDRHLADRLDLPPWLFHQHPADLSDPTELGFECHRVLAEQAPDADWFGFIEDDLIVHDPGLLDKLAWFSSAFGDRALLQPNRYEAALGGRLERLYVDGPLRPGVVQPWLRPEAPEVLAGPYGARRLRFERARNPHSGCFFLNRSQWGRWRSSGWWGDRDRAFIGPLESAATLGLLKTFDVYKTAATDSDFVEIEHGARAFLGMVGRQVAYEPAEFGPDPAGREGA